MQLHLKPTGKPAVLGPTGNLWEKLISMSILPYEWADREQVLRDIPSELGAHVDIWRFILERNGRPHR